MVTVIESSSAVCIVLDLQASNEPFESRYISEYT